MYIDYLSNQTGSNKETLEFVEDLHGCLINEIVISQLKYCQEQALEDALKGYEEQFVAQKKKLLEDSEKVFSVLYQEQPSFKRELRKRVKNSLEKWKLKDSLVEEGITNVLRQDYKHGRSIVMKDLGRIYSKVLKEVYKERCVLFDKNEFKTCLKKYAKEEFGLNKKTETEIYGTEQQSENDTAVVEGSNERGNLGDLQSTSDNGTVEANQKEEPDYDTLVSNLFSNLKGVEMMSQADQRIFKDNLFLDLCSVALVFFNKGKDNRALEICKKLFKEENVQYLNEGSKSKVCDTIVFDKLKGDETLDGYKKALDKVINPSKHLNRNAKEASIVSRFFNFAKERLLNSNVRGILSDYRYIAQELINEKRFDIARKINNELLAIYNQLFTGYKSIKGEQNVQDLEASYNFFVSTSFLNLNNIKKCLEQLDDLEYSSCIEGLFLLELEKWYKEDSLLLTIYS